MPAVQFTYAHDGRVKHLTEAELRAHLRDWCLWTPEEIDGAIRHATRSGTYRHTTAHSGTIRIATT
jgi:hypothetical protein